MNSLEDFNKEKYITIGEKVEFNSNYIVVYLS